MKQVSWLISKYLVSTIVPYFVFSWLLLSVILFVQQASRYSDIFFSVNIPTNLIWQLTIALVPTVISFTCPMAMLVGTIIGLTKMQGDSELVAIRASGVGNFQIALPIFVLGVIMSIFAFVVNLEGVPIAASLVRSVALQTAIKKLESPIEPGVFNSEIAGYTIYVKGADFETSTWKNIFIYSEDKTNGNVRLITSRNGRIDTTGQFSELVLENATISTLPIQPGAGKYVSENVADVRFAIKTKRSELIEKLSLSELRPEELGLQQLSEYASSKDGRERTEAQILWQRRIILSITPLIFCLLGTAIVLRFNRGGRGFGIAMALAVLIGFFLLTFLGEQMARVGMIGVFLSSLVPVAGSVAAIVWFSFSKKISLLGGVVDRLRSALTRIRRRPEKIQTRNMFVDLTTGLRDFDLLLNLIKNFLLTLFFLSTVFIIFTAFELWKFAGALEGGVILLGKYLLYLLPFVYLQIAPSAAMIGTLATYVIKSRQNEIVTWTSAGQSVYRLILPCFLLMILLGAGNWIIQERILPRANQLQDANRTLIRNRGVPVEQSGKYWVANEKRIYSFEFASDNEKRIDARSGEGTGEYEFSEFATLDYSSTGRFGATVFDHFGSRDHGLHSLDESESDNVLRLESNFEADGARPVDASDNATRVRNFSVNEMAASDNDTSIHAAIFGAKGKGASDNSVGVRRSLPEIRTGARFNVDHSAAVRFPLYGMIAPVSPLVALTVVASDNENRRVSCASGCVGNLVVYEFADNGERLQAVYRAERAEWVDGRVRFSGNVEKNDLRDGKISTMTLIGGELAESQNPFAELRTKPSHLNSGELKRQIAAADSELERRNLTVGLEKKYTTLFLPFVMALFTAPFSLSLSRKGKAATVGYAIGLWLLFTGTSVVFDQLGLNGLLAPQLAVWSPLIIFSLFGIYLLSKVRT